MDRIRKFHETRGLGDNFTRRIAYVVDVDLLPMPTGGTSWAEDYSFDEEAAVRKNRSVEDLFQRVREGGFVVLD